MGGVLAIAGTAKGAFLLRSDRGRSEWSIDGPLFKGWKVTATSRDATGRYFAGTASDVYGPAIHVSDDLEAFDREYLAFARQIAGLD